MAPGLLSGLAGVAWALHELTENEAPDVDDILAACATRRPWTGLLELAYGLTGLAVYALARRPRPAADRILDATLDHLEERAVSVGAGLAWRTPGHLLPPRTPGRSPEGHFDLGLAHGVPGIVMLLAKLVEADVHRARARALLEGGVAWLLAQRRPEGFGRWHDGQEIYPARRAVWCYGDLGVAAALWTAARATGEASWRSIAISLVDAAARRPIDACNVEDPGFCHGAFGVAHIFDRFYRATDEARHREAAIAWIERGLAMRRPGGIAGFWARQRTRDGRERWTAATGLLEGAAGIGLVLLAALADAPPSWNQVVLVDVG